MHCLWDHAKGDEASWQGRATNISSHPRVMILHDFLSDSECEHLISVAKPHLTVSTVADPSGKAVPSKDRTSQVICNVDKDIVLCPISTCPISMCHISKSQGTFLPRSYNKIVDRIERRVAEGTRLPVGES